MYVYVFASNKWRDTFSYFRNHTDQRFDCRSTAFHFRICQANWTQAHFRWTYNYKIVLEQPLSWIILGTFSSCNRYRVSYLHSFCNYNRYRVWHILKGILILFICFLDAEQQLQEVLQNSETSSTSSEPLVVSVTIKYPLQHPIFDLLKLISEKPVPKVYITNDFEHWTTGSFVTDIPNPNDLDLNMNLPIFIMPFEPWAFFPST